jgi:LuxR family maltose regulon positive regulatory protein
VFALAEPAGCVRLFLDEGEPMAALLARYAATQPARPYVQTLLEAFPGRAAQAGVPNPTPNGQAAAPLEPLRVREAEILRLLAAGHSNPEIAARLSLSVDTVRWYIKQLYRKLDVHNRTQAALRARELGLA